MKIYCRACSKLVLDVDVKAPVMNPTAFKQTYGEYCPHCGVPYSDQFKVKDAALITPVKRLNR